MRIISLLALISLGPWVSASPAAECFEYRTHLPLLGAADTPGVARAVATAGDYAYVADGEAGLAVLRISEPGNPLLVATLHTSGDARDIAISGDLAILAEGPTGITVIDVSDPEAPILLGGINTPGDAFAVAFAATSQQIIVADYTSGLAIVDLGDPGAPAIAGSVDTPGFAVDVVLADDQHACVADSWAGVQIVSVTDPKAPAIVAQIPTASEAAVGVHMQGPLLYVAEAEQPSGVAIFDLTNPITPNSLGYCNTPGVSGVSVSGAHAYLSAGPLIYVIDVTDPDQPHAVGAAYGPGVAGLAADGDRLLVAAGSAGLRIIDTHSPESPLLGFRRLSSYSSINGVAIAGDRAFVSLIGSLGDGALYAIEATPSLPVIGVYYMSTPITEMFADAAHVYATVGNRLDIFDVSDPNPLFLGSTVIPAGRGVAVAAGTAFVATDASGLVAVDVSNPISPKLIGQIALPGQAWDVAVAGSVAWVTSRNAGLFGVDILNPKAMAIIGNVGVPGEAGGVNVDGELAYVAAGTSGIAVVDLSSPDAPLLIGQVDTPGIARDIALRGHIAYVADSGSGLQAIDVANPENPRLLGGTYPGFGQTNNHGTYSPGSGVQVAIAPELIGLAAGLGGFRAYQLQCELVTTVGVTNLTAVSTRSGITLRCQVHADLASLRLQRAIESGGERSFAILPGTPDAPPAGGNWEYVDMDVLPGGTYIYELIATFRNGESRVVDSIQATAPPAERTRLVVTPNPARQEAFIELWSRGVREPRVVLIYDAGGRCVQRLALAPAGVGFYGGLWNGRDAEGRELARGTYYLRVAGDDSEPTARLTLLR